MNQVIIDKEHLATLIKNGKCKLISLKIRTAQELENSRNKAYKLLVP